MFHVNRYESKKTRWLETQFRLMHLLWFKTICFAFFLNAEYHPIETLFEACLQGMVVSFRLFDAYRQMYECDVARPVMAFVFQQHVCRAKFFSENVKMQSL